MIIDFKITPPVLDILPESPLLLSPLCYFKALTHTHKHARTHEF